MGADRQGQVQYGPRCGEQLHIIIIRARSLALLAVSRCRCGCMPAMTGIHDSFLRDHCQMGRSKQPVLLASQPGVQRSVHVGHCILIASVLDMHVQMELADANSKALHKKRKRIEQLAAAGACPSSSDEERSGDAKRDQDGCGTSPASPSTSSSNKDDGSYSQDATAPDCCYMAGLTSSK